MKIERGNVFIGGERYYAYEMCMCVGTTESMVWYIAIGTLKHGYRCESLTVQKLYLGCQKSTVKGTYITDVIMKIPLTFLDKDALAAYSHIKKEFLDTNIL